jgi:hypothetical protein
MQMPKYRDDVKGHLKETMQDCIALMAGEIRNADHFIISAEDCELASKEYADYLTAAELKRCFKQAQKA